MKSKDSHKYSKAEIKEAIRLYVDERLGYLKVAAKTGMFWTNVMYHVRKAGKNRKKPCKDGRAEKHLRHLLKKYPNGVYLSGGTLAHYTGLLTQNNDYAFIPVLRCDYAGHEFKGSSKYHLPHRCPKCVEEVGGRLVWSRMQDKATEFGMSPDDYRKLRDSQRNSQREVCCAVCGLPENGRRLDIDHSHQCSKKFGRRGLVHSDCNKGDIARAERIFRGKENLPLEKYFRLHMLNIINSYLKPWEKVIKTRMKRKQ